MNRKEKREQQNDISIIENLPQRLQRKIAENLQLHGIINNQQQQQQQHNVAVECQKVKSNAEQASATTCAQNGFTEIDYFLRLKNKQHVEPAAAPQNGYRRAMSMKKQHAARSASSDAANQNYNKHTAVPGILRIKSRADDAAAVMDKAENSEIVSANLALSPAHQQQQQQKSSRPNWLWNAVDMPLLTQLNELHGVYVQLQQQQMFYENWSDFAELRAQMQQIFLQLLLHHIKFCFEHKVDAYFWKLLYYNVREHLKHSAAMQPQANECILMLLEDGLTFYAHIYTQISNKYAKLTNLTNGTQTAHKFETVAKVMGQKFLICLGDLSRYKTKQLQSNDYATAVAYYEQAQTLIPTNGIPYNQLAIVAIIQRKSFDAVYFHMRSLMSSNSICSARESLMGLFYELRKKFKESEQKSSPLHLSYADRKSQTTKSLRKEVWIYPDGVRRLHRTDMNSLKSMINEENRLSELKTEEIWRQFILLYLHIIGKLYAAIGMESMHEHQRQLLVNMNILFQRDAWQIAQSKLLKIAALNIFVVEQNKKEARREVRYHAFNFGNQVFGLLTRRANELLNETVDDLEKLQEENLEELNLLLQYIRIYLEWLELNIEIWEPVRNEDHIVLNSWQELEQLFTHINKLLKHKTFLELTASQDILLEEDNFLQGFTPFQAVMRKQHDTDTHSALTQFTLRLQKIAHFQTCYTANRKYLQMLGNEAFVMEDLHVDMKAAIDHLKISCENNENEGVVNIKRSKSNSELMMKLPLNCNNAADDTQLAQLSRLKQKLQAQTNVKKMYNDKLEQILSFVDSNVYVEVRPKYLLPDTNCFIDCLEDFERLAKEFRHYSFIIPLTVVRELDGLSKGVKPSFSQLPKSRIQHFDEVTSMAKKSLEFIKTNKNIKCATTKGSFINSSLFALVEEEPMSNDDKILATAVALSKTLSNETNKDGKCFIQTELVLITTDRNLRVKALTRNLAVSGLSEFLQWAKDCKIL